MSTFSTLMRKISVVKLLASGRNSSAESKSSGLQSGSGTFLLQYLDLLSGTFSIVYHKS